MIILDASAVIALLRNEDGAHVVRDSLNGALMSVVNLAETANTARRRLGLTFEEVRSALESGGVSWLVPDIEIGRLAWRYMAAATPEGKRMISLGDGFCLAHAHRDSLPALTADHAWTQAEFADPVEIKLIR